MVQKPSEQKSLASDPFNRVFGDYIRKLREGKKIAQQELASHLRVSVDRLDHIERGQDEVSVSIANAVADYLGVEVTQLFNAVQDAVSGEISSVKANTRRTLIFTLPFISSIPGRDIIPDDDIRELVMGYFKITSERRRKSVLQLIHDYGGG